MSNELTIKQLKALEVGDWVWISRLNNKQTSGYVTDINFTAKMFTCKSVNRVATTARIADYGKTWLAYKNKEQAEGEYDSRVEEAKKRTAKEIFDEVIEACTVQLNAAEVDEYDNRYSKAWGRYWEGKISGAMNCRADILNIAKKYGVEVDG